MKENVQRKCGNCAAAFDESCSNAVETKFNPENVCELHETVAEYEADLAAIKLFRQRLGIEPGNHG